MLRGFLHRMGLYARKAKKTSSEIQKKRVISRGYIKGFSRGYIRDFIGVFTMVCVGKCTEFYIKKILGRV